MRWERRAAGLIVAWEPANPDAAARLSGARRTESFSLGSQDGRRVLLHRLAIDQIDNDLGDRIAGELVRPGLVDDFETAFAGVVSCTAADPLTAWERFYRQTLAGLRRRADGPGAVATFAAIYRRALDLVVGGSLLDAGSCFGFFCLLAAQQGLAVRGTDVSRSTMALATHVAARLRIAATFSRADVRTPLPGAADTVTAIHLLEHLSPSDVDRALAQLCAAAARRVIVAVPLESRPDLTYGHRTAFDLRALRSRAARVPGWWAAVHEHRGGWLVLDRLRGSFRNYGDAESGRRCLARTPESMRGPAT